jgi:aspartate aminotransferase-like enzyme
MIRVNHYGPDADRDVVHAALAGLGAALAESGFPVDLEGARRAVAPAWG